MDVAVQKIVALGVPGLILLFVISATGYAGGAAITAALATLGGPFGMLGGLAVLGALTLITNSLSKYGLEALAKAVVKGLKDNGTSAREIRRTVNKAPITRGMKDHILQYV